jgi:hypothetical protein
MILSGDSAIDTLYRERLSRDYKDPVIQVLTPKTPFWPANVVLLSAEPRQLPPSWNQAPDRWVGIDQRLYRSTDRDVIIETAALTAKTEDEALRAAKVAAYLHAFPYWGQIDFLEGPGPLTVLGTIDGDRGAAPRVERLTNGKESTAYRVVLYAQLKSSVFQSSHSQPDPRLTRFEVQLGSRRPTRVTATPEVDWSMEGMRNDPGH